MSDKPFVPISLNTAALDAVLARVEQATGDLTPLMASLRQELLSETEANFAAQGRPAWPALSQVTIGLREKRDKWPGPMLQVSSTGLASKILGQSDATSAMVGVSDEVPYARIQQLGGQAGVNRKVAIPARPYLPMIGGQLQPEAEEVLIEVAQGYLERAVAQ